MYKAKKEYWIIQFIGWGIFVFVNSLIQISFTKEGLIVVLHSFVLGSLSVLITHLVRFIILKNSLINLKGILFTLIGLILIAGSSVFLSILFFGLYIPFLGAFIHLSYIKTSEIFGATFNMGLIYAIWLSVYYAYLFFSKQRQLSIEKINLELELKEAELNQLKKQLSPHFLFNSLNNIRSLILEDKERAREAITYVSDLLRYALNYQEKETVTIQEEMDVVESYIELNKIHFEENVNFIVNINHQSLNVEIPPMSIQTLIENAIKHGVSKAVFPTSLNLDINTKEKGTTITIKNEGELKETKRKGIGIENLKRRLTFIYEENAVFELKEDKGSVIAVIKIKS